MVTVKLLLAALLVLPAAFGLGAREVQAPTRPQDPPVDCPLCGIDVRVHAAVLSTCSSLNASFALRALAAFYG
jgi:hypothetical protein